MCLDKVISTKKPKGEIEVWKTFLLTSGGRLLTRYTRKKAPRETWLKATRKKIRTTDYQLYTTGFHAYAEKPPDWLNASLNGEIKVVKVKLRGVRIVGEQDNRLVYVADEMFIPRTRNRRKDERIP